MANVDAILAGVTLPAISRYRLTRMDRGGRAKTASGRVVVSIVALKKHRFTLDWLNLSEADYLVIRNAYDLSQADYVSFRSPQNITYTVIASPDGEELEVQITGWKNRQYYTITMVLEEQ